ncbi:MAG: hypothetical protein ACP5HU_02125 [Phycisphaerae bacterium]
MSTWLIDNLLQLMLLLPLAAAVVAVLSRTPPVALAVALTAGVLELVLAAMAAMALAVGVELMFISDWVRAGLGLDLALMAGPPRVGAVAALAFTAGAVAMWAYRRGALTPARTALGMLMLSAAAGAVMAADMLLLATFVEAAWLPAVVLVAASRGPASAGRLMLPCLMVTAALTAGVVWLAWLHCEATGVLSFAHGDLLHTDEYLAGKALATMDMFRTTEPLRLAGWAAVYIVGFASLLAAMRRALSAETLSGGAKMLAAAHVAFLVLSAATAALPARDAAVGWSGSHLAALAFAAVTTGLAWLGLLACGAYLVRSGRRMAEPQDIRGLARKYPDVAFAAGICLISLAGLPLTGGFFARVMLLSSAAGTGALLAMLLFVPPMIALSATYLSMVLAIAFTGRPAPHEHISLPGLRGALWRAGIAAVVTALVILGILPHLLAEPLRMLTGR